MLNLAFEHVSDLQEYVENKKSKLVNSETLCRRLFKKFSDGVNYIYIYWNLRNRDIPVPVFFSR